MARARQSTQWRSQRQMTTPSYGTPAFGAALVAGAAGAEAADEAGGAATGAGFFFLGGASTGSSTGATSVLPPSPGTYASTGFGFGLGLGLGFGGAAGSSAPGEAAAGDAAAGTGAAGDVAAGRALAPAVPPAVGTGAAAVAARAAAAAAAPAVTPGTAVMPAPAAFSPSDFSAAGGGGGGGGGFSSNSAAAAARCASAVTAPRPQRNDSCSCNSIHRATRLSVCGGALALAQLGPRSRMAGISAICACSAPAASQVAASNGAACSALPPNPKTASPENASLATTRRPDPLHPPFNLKSQLPHISIQLRCGPASQATRSYAAIIPRKSAHLRLAPPTSAPCT